jgi:hypothetical protein
VGAALVAIAFLNAHAAGRTARQSTLPALPSAKVHAAAAAAGTDVVALDAGGPAAGSFAADADFTAAGTWTYKTSAAIDTSLIASSAPAPTNPNAKEPRSPTRFRA